MTKRLFDVILGGIGLMLLSPLLAAIAVVVKLSDGGPVFYEGERVGLHGNRFHMLKFRTMVSEAPCGGILYAGRRSADYARGSPPSPVQAR